jgi:uncharacterized delta-60 repeat protein
MNKKLISFVLCVLLFATVFIVEVPINVNAQIIEEWVARYDGPISSGDLSFAITTDSNGYIYITGRSEGDGTGMDFVTIKYDPNGTQLWAARYNGPADWTDWPFEIAVDSQGNVYVTGYSCDQGPYGIIDPDYATIKYDPEGNELWVARYDGPPGPGNSHDSSRAIALDSTGNVYVTGNSKGIETNYDYATIKYDQNGTELWVARFDSGGGPDSAYDMAVDSAGNIYVTGSSGDYATIKYDPDGNELWVARYDGPDNGPDSAYALEVDESGNVYVTGDSGPPDPGGLYLMKDYATVKYDTNGSQLWVARYDGPGNFWDSSEDIAVDHSGNVYVTGRSAQNSIEPYNFDFTTVAYDPSGNQRWVRRFNGPGNGDDMGRDVKVDPTGKIYVTGWSTGIGTDRDFTTIAYDPSGNELWKVNYNGPGNGMDIARAMNIDTSGDVYVTGYSTGIGTGYDMTTIKYSYQEPKPESTIDIDPDTLNLKSKGRWITCYITLNDPYDVNDIDISTVILENTIPTEWGDVQNDTLMVKFDRSEVEDYIGVPQESIELTITGELMDGTPFEGSDTIRVIDPGK